MKKVGVIGVGVMGGPMTLNLLKAGYHVTVFNRTRSKCQPAADAGGGVADSIQAVVTGMDAVVIMVNVDRDVCEVVLGPGGVLAAGCPGLLVIDSTTIHPITSQRLAARLGDEGIDYLDAPVMSDSEDARRAELWFQVGGEQQAYVRAVPLFEAMGNRHMHLGRSGAGTGAKCGSFSSRWWKKRGYVEDEGVCFG